MLLTTSQPEPASCALFCNHPSFYMARFSVLLSFLLITGCANANLFYNDFYTSWAADHCRTLNDGQLMQLTLDQSSGSGFASYKKFLFGSIDMQIQLVPGNSAGTVTAYYLSSDSISHDELDFEFLGNLSGQPYILQTNVYASGVGGREQRFYLWFDPTANFHTYSVLWNQQHVVFLVDGIPLRVFRNNEDVGVPYLNKQPMGIFSSLWNGDDWATRGGLVKIDWSGAPFVASYANYNLDACEWTGVDTNCPAFKWWNQGTYQVLDANQTGQLNWVQQNYMVYDYCSDTARYPTRPPECGRQW